PDGTRRIDLVPALNALCERFPNHGPIVVGLGLHRKMTDAELDPLRSFTPIQHDPDDVVRTCDVGGVVGSVFRPVAEAPFSIAVGVAELHQYAGLSGGHKAVAVGCGGRETILSLHHRDRVMAEGVRLGKLVGNPFRETVDALGRAARCLLALVYVPAADCWLCGDPDLVLGEALARLDPWQMHPGCSPGAVLTVPPAKAVSLYQASRAATYLALSPSPPVVDGGTIILRALCPEGLGCESGFVAALKNHAPPWSELLQGPAPTGPGSQRAVMLALLASKYELKIEGCENPDVFRSVGISATVEESSVPSTWLHVPHPFQCLPQVATPQEGGEG
ncbi:MAG: lactate racemase domain-containing protein, partial [Myxococcota bacterium]